MILFYLVLIYYSLYTQVHPAKKSDIQKYMWVYLNVLADACVHFTGKKSNHANTMSFWRHHVDLQTFAVFFKTDTHGRCTPSQLVLSRKWRHQSKTQISYLSCFPSRLTPINTFCQLKSTERYKNVSRALYLA